MDTKQDIGRKLRTLVLERCNSVWILNTTYRNQISDQVLERCNSVWILNFCNGDTVGIVVLERCNSVWILNKLRRSWKRRTVLERCNSVLIFQYQEKNKIMLGTSPGLFCLMGASGINKKIFRKKYILPIKGDRRLFNIRKQRLYPG